jgi:predicted AlkP superfamily phosphohydrolase/phosphomutase
MDTLSPHLSPATMPRVRIAWLPLLGVLVAACSAEPDGAARPRLMPRLLIVGWDGATFDLVDPLRKAGRLPHVAALEARGTSAVLESTIIPISSAAWVASVTGKGPGETGVYSFFEPVEDSYDVRLVSSLSNQAPPIWRILARHGLRSHVFGVPLTFPPEPGLGTMVAGMLSPLDGTYASPPERTDELRERGFVPDLGIWRELQVPSQEFINTQLDLKQDIVTELLTQDDWDFAMVVFKSLDLLSHRAYDGRTDTQVAELVVRLDSILGAMVEAAGPNTHVILMSDHGFATFSRQFNIHSWLLDAGFAQAAEGAELPPRSSGPLVESRPVEHSRRMAQLDLASSVAIAQACEGSFGSVRLNLRGREPEGCVAPEDKDELLARIEAELRAIQVGDVPLVTEVWRGPDLYPGPHSHVIPDLMFEVLGDIQVVASDVQPTFATHAQPIPDHALDGILVAAGPRIRRSDKRGRAAITDITPTALHLLGLPVHREMTGVVQGAWIEGTTPVREVAEPAEVRVRPAAGSAFSAEQIEQLRARLKQLGYTD